MAHIIDDMPTKGHYFGGINVVLRPHPDIEHCGRPTAHELELVLKFCQLLDPNTPPVDSEVGQRSMLWVYPELTTVLAEECRVVGRQRKTFRRRCRFHPQDVRQL